MGKPLAGEIARLAKLQTGELRERFGQVFGEQPKSRNREYLFKRIAFRLQEQANGTLLERVKALAAELVDETAIRMTGGGRSAAKELQKCPGGTRDPRLPGVGTVLTKDHRGKTHKVLVTEDGFEFEGLRYRSLSAIAKRITGIAWNGFLFFGLANRPACPTGRNAGRRGAGA